MSFGAGAWTIIDWLFVAFATACSTFAVGVTGGSFIALIRAEDWCGSASWSRRGVDIGRAQKAELITAIISASTDNVSRRA